MSEGQNYNEILRKRAEKQINRDETEIDDLDREELKKRLHELKVFQAELELQNEELRQTQIELINAKDHYSDLYHKAPVGHITIDSQGVVNEVNSSFVELIGKPLEKITGSHFFRYVKSLDQARYLGWFDGLSKRKGSDYLELNLDHETQPELRVQIYGRCIETSSHDLPVTPKSPDVMLTVIDVTEKWLWHRELERTNNYLNRAIETGNLAWWHMDAKTGIVHFHRKKTDMLKYPYEEFEGKTYHVFTDLLHPEDEPVAVQAMRDHLEGKKTVYEVEYRIKSSDGQYYWFRDFGKISEYSDDGVPLSLTGIVIDITSQKKSQQILEESERKYRLLAENTKDLVCLHEPNGSYLYISPSVEAMTGFTPEELIGRNAYEFFHEADIERIRKESYEASLENRQIDSIAYRFRKKDGSYLWMETSTIPILDPSGTVAQLVTSSRDYTVRKAMMDSLSTERSLLNATFDAIRGGIIIIDNNLRIIKINKTMQEWSGNELIGLQCRDAFPDCPGSCENCQTQQVMQNREYRHRILHFTAQKGDDKVLHLHSYPLVDGETVTGVVQFADDITEVTRIQKDLEKSEHRWRTVFEKSKEGIVMADQETAHFQYANAAWSELTGYDQSDLTNLTITDIHPIENAKENRELFVKAANGEIDHLPEIQIKRKDGELCWVELSTYPITLENQNYLVGAFRDITDRKLTRDALKKSEALSRFILDSSPDSMFIIDRQTMQFVDCNKEACHSLGLTREEMLAKGLHDIEPNYTKDELAAVFDEIIDCSSRSGRIETIHIKKDGSTLPVEIFIGAARHDDRVLLVASARDITDRLQAVSALKESEERYAMAQDVAKVGSWEWIIESGSVFWSEEAYRIFGQDKETFEVTYESYMECLHPDDRIIISDSVEKRLSGEGEYDVEHRIILPDGSIRWVASKGGLALDEQGNPERMVGIVQDITDKKQGEQRMRLLSYVVEHSPFLIILTDPKGDIEYVNPKFTEITGYSAEEALGKNPRILKSGIKKSEEYKEMWQTITSGREWRGEVYNKKKDGSFYWAQVSIASISSGNRKISHYIGIQEDITDRKLMEMELIKAKEQAEKANQAKSTFLASMSHELRTPLNSILGFSQILRNNRNQTLSDKELTYVSNILISGQLLLELINDVLDLSKIESGKFDISLEPVSLKTVVAEAFDQVGSLAAKHEVKVIIDKNTPDEFVQVDNRGIKQVLINLLSNAIKYNKKGGEVRIVGSLPNPDQIIVAVSDTGPGITEEKLELLFQPFNRLGAESTNIEGTGIGLTITKRLIEMMKGEITVESEPGKGSAFQLLLQRAENPGIVTKEKAAQPDETAGPRLQVKRTVLYVEDNTVNLKLMESILGSFQNLKLISASNAEEGIAKAKSHKPDVVLMDINLPGMDGFKALQTLKESAETNKIPVIAVTANAMVGDSEKAIEAGFYDYITKPIQVGRFKEIIGKLLFDF